MCFDWLGCYYVHEFETCHGACEIMPCIKPCISGGTPAIDPRFFTMTNWI